MAEKGITETIKIGNTIIHISNASAVKSANEVEKILANIAKKAQQDLNKTKK